MKRTTPLRRGAGLQRHAELSRTPWARTVPATAPPRQPIKPVSVQRQAENRVRRAMADRLWPDRREGTVMCGCGRPECQRPADDLHEPLSRARGGSITDEGNAIPLSRHCHDEITFRPESELQWAYDAGLLVHSWDADTGDAA